MSEQTMTQEAPYPEALAALVERLSHKPGWRFRLAHIDRGQGSVGLTLSIYVTGPNSYDPAHNMTVHHSFIVPAAAYDERAWTRWLFDRCLDVETHEAGEFFRVDGHRPFAPNHGPGRNPYSILERGTEDDAKTLSSGQRNPNEEAV